METLRAFFKRRRALAFGLVALALCLKALVPAGFMIGADSRTLTVEICHDASGESTAQRIVVPVKRTGGDAPGKPAKGECPYGALSMASLGGADPVLLALALAFILALGFAPVRTFPAERAHRLRPPLRGPPLPA